MPSLIEYKLEYLSRLFASLTHLPQAQYHHHHDHDHRHQSEFYRVDAHSKSQLKVSGYIELTWSFQAYVVYDISSTLFFLHKPMEHANMCSKLSVFEQGRIKTCASLSRPCNSLWEINLATDFLFRYIYSRSGQFLEIFIMFENFRNLSILFS